ncbi:MULTISPECIES: STAS domain-containing protein [Aphanothece]|uniref:STAS domain-containing protein n=1 Tax=Aphanothece TaxID=1121 RepID=UPI0039853787
MSLKLSETTANGWQVIGVAGSVDSKTVNELRDFLDEHVKGGNPVVLDLAEVPFMSSAGLRTLLTLHRQTQELGVSLALVGLRQEIADTMKVTGFFQYFTVFSSLSDLPPQ